MTQPLILLCNDDGIDSPGLAAAASALAALGDLLIVAPSQQQSGMGRSMPNFNDGRLFKTTISANGQAWTAYGANASPAQAVQHGIMELADRQPALVVSGINYGENVGTGITVSGTVGAALEAAAHGIPALAVSLQVEIHQHMTNDASVDFSGAEYFTHLFAQRWLNSERLPDVDALKIDIPAGATPQTCWCFTHLERRSYFRPVAPQRDRLEDVAPIGYELNPANGVEAGSDAAALIAGQVSVTPLSLDMTSRITLDTLRDVLGGCKS
ncbi:MAG: 5'/3'-nucleotidase SurE [Anaerolineae bacterium]|nr:5'/3'-nucleotidase SurE [Anaerolineae bacterium]